MFGISRIKRQLDNLKEEVDRRLPEACNGVRDLKKDVASLQLELELLKLEIKNPPKYKVGDVIKYFTVMEVLPISLGSITKRYYKVLDSRGESLMEVSEGILRLREKQ